MAIKKPSVWRWVAEDVPHDPKAVRCESDHNKGTIKSATMLMILMSGFTAGPAVSL